MYLIKSNRNYEISFYYNTHNTRLVGNLRSLLNQVWSRNERGEREEYKDIVDR